MGSQVSEKVDKFLAVLSKSIPGPQHARRRQGQNFGDVEALLREALATLPADASVRVAIEADMAGCTKRIAALLGIKEPPAKRSKPTLANETDVALNAVFAERIASSMATSTTSGQGEDMALVVARTPLARDLLIRSLLQKVPKADDLTALRTLCASLEPFVMASVLHAPNRVNRAGFLLAPLCTHAANAVRFALASNRVPDAIQALEEALQLVRAVQLLVHAPSTLATRPSFWFAMTDSSVDSLSQVSALLLALTAETMAAHAVRSNPSQSFAALVQSITVSLAPHTALLDDREARILLADRLAGLAQVDASLHATLPNQKERALVENATWMALYHVAILGKHSVWTEEDDFEAAVAEVSRYAPYRDLTSVAQTQGASSPVAVYLLGALLAHTASDLLKKHDAASAAASVLTEQTRQVVPGALITWLDAQPESGLILQLKEAAQRDAGALAHVLVQQVKAEEVRALVKAARTEWVHGGDKVASRGVVGGAAELDDALLFTIDTLGEQRTNFGTAWGGEEEERGEEENLEALTSDQEEEEDE